MSANDDRLRALAARLAASRRRLASGEAPELAGLAEAIEAALADARSAPPGDRLALIALLEECESLVDAVRDERDALSAELEALRRRERAGQAYGSSASGASKDRR